MTCYKCGRVLAHVDVTIDREGIRRFREKAQEIKRKHRCASTPVLASNENGPKPVND